MKKIVVALLAMLLPGGVFASHQVVTITEAGTLSTSLLPAWKQTLDSLTVRGPINGADMIALRSMVGLNIETSDMGGHEDAHTYYLNLKDVTFVEDGVKFYDYSGYGAIVGYIKAGALAAYSFMYSKVLEEIVLPSSITEIGRYALANCVNLKKITFTSDVVKIADNICNNTGLEEIELPASVQSLGEGAFRGCRSLRKAVLSQNLTELPSNLFYNGYSLTSVTIPSANISKIGTEAFFGCSILQEINLATATAPTLGFNVFAGNPSDNPEYDHPGLDKATCVLRIPSGVENTSYTTAAEWSEFLRKEVYDETAGVERLNTVAAPEVVGRYGLDGSRQAASRKGVSVVKYADGTVRKVIVK